MKRPLQADGSDLWQILPCAAAHTPPRALQVLLLIVAILVVIPVLIRIWQTVGITLWTIFGIVDLTAQPEYLAALVGPLVRSHLQGHGGIVALLGAGLCVVNVSSCSRSRHPHLTGSFVGAHLKADSGMVHRCLDTVLWVIQMPSCSISSHSRLAGTLIGTHL